MWTRGASVIFLLLLAAGCRAAQMNSTRADDEQAIRKWFETWKTATNEGDLSTVHSLIADDAVLLVPGNDRMNKTDFAAAVTRDPTKEEGVTVEVSSEIQEISVSGDTAYLWSSTEVIMTPTDGSKATKWAGHSLSILKRQGDGWVMFRDANTVMPVPE